MNNNIINSVKVGKLAEDLYLAFKNKISTLLIGRWEDRSRAVRLEAGGRGDRR